MAINQYLDRQKENLRSSLNWKPFAEIFPLVDKLYVDALGLMPPDRSPVFGHLLLICHKSFLSAVALIGQAQPDDAGPITRRAIEVARFAAIIKTNPEKAEEWVAYSERTQRWADRQEGKKPKRLHVNFGEVHAGVKPTIDDLMQMHGILSDADVHFTPEYFHQLDWDKRNGSLYLNYFTRDQTMLEREIVLMSGTHLRILEVIDWCLDGAFRSNPDWLKLVGTLKEKVAPLTRKFEHPDAQG